MSFGKCLLHGSYIRYNQLEFSRCLYQSGEKNPQQSFPVIFLVQILQFYTLVKCTDLEFSKSAEAAENT